MPRYRFHCRKDLRPGDDAVVDLPNIAAARIEAAEMMGRELRDSPETIWSDEEWSIEVFDDSGLALYRLSSLAMRAPATRG